MSVPRRIVAAAVQLSPVLFSREGTTQKICERIVSPEGELLAQHADASERIVMAELDMALVRKRKRMMDSVGHYSRPELLSLLINREPQPHTRAAVVPDTSL